MSPAKQKLSAGELIEIEAIPRRWLTHFCGRRTKHLRKLAEAGYADDGRHLNEIIEAERLIEFVDRACEALRDGAA